MARYHSLFYVRLSRTGSLRIDHQKQHERTEFVCGAFFGNLTESESDNMVGLPTFYPDMDVISPRV